MPRDPFDELDEEVEAKYSGRGSHMDTLMAIAKKKKNFGKEDSDSLYIEMYEGEEKPKRKKMTKSMLRLREMERDSLMHPVGR